MKTKRIAPGLYSIEIARRKFEIELQANYWHIYEIKGNGPREWWNDYLTKREAIKALESSTNLKFEWEAYRAGK